MQADAKTIKFREKVLKKGGIWRDIYGIDEKKVASMVREDKVDILVELTGHTANNKLGMMACRPAPVQVCLGLSCSLGCSAEILFSVYLVQLFFFYIDFCIFYAISCNLVCCGRI